MKPHPPATGQAAVEFLTAAGDRCDFIPLTVFRHDDQDNVDGFAVAPGLKDVSRLLWDARTSEAVSALARGVIVKAPQRTYSGKSYGLALAIADKQAHFGVAALAGRVVATGVVLEGEGGRIGRVDAFEVKARAVLTLGVAAAGLAPRWISGANCTAAVRNLTADSQGDPVRIAVERCRWAVRTQPDSARMHFLLGQAYAVNRTPHAADEWAEAARLGDVDGMTAHGQALWAKGDGRGARQWLRRAAEHGSQAGMESLSQLLHEEGATPAEQDEGRLWAQRARALSKAALARTEGSE